MGVVLLMGGARAGKSALAVDLVSATPPPVTFIATAEALDEEMAARIARHRQRRPASFVTVEEPLELERVIQAAPSHRAVVIDCLTLWVANLMGSGHDDRAVESLARSAAAAAAGRPATTVVVSNEVGWGIVPADELSRRYRDLLGQVNSLFAAQADDVYLVVAGRVMSLARPKTVVTRWPVS